jgi:hypothetical protein
MADSFTNYKDSRLRIMASLVPAELSWPPRITTSLFDIKVAVSASTESGNFTISTVQISFVTSYYSIESMRPLPSYPPKT